MSATPWDFIAKLVCIGDSGCGKSSLTIRLCEGRFVQHHDVTIGVEFGSRIVPVGPPHSKTLPPSTLLSSASATTAALLSTSSAQSGAGVVQTDDGASPSSQPPPPPGLPEPPRAAAPSSSSSAGPQKHMKLSLWDTAGQETYKSVTRSYFRGASGALLVFDLTRRSTFEHATDWLNDLRQIAEPDIVVVLVGNKADLTKGTDEDEDEDGDNHPREGGDESGGGNSSSSGRRGAGGRREVTRQEAEAWARRNGVLEYVETSAKSGVNVEMAFMRVAERIYQNIQAGRYDLNDRRSGVKGPGAGGGAGGRQVQLTTHGQKGAGGGCC